MKEPRIVPRWFAVLFLLLVAATDLLTLSGCVHELPAATGPIYPFNQGLWHPTPADLAVQ